MGHDSIVGTWTLVSMTVKSSKGDEFFPLGKNPVGRIIYTVSGDMAVVLMRSGRPKFASGDAFDGTPEEIKQAFEGFDAYSGTYEVEIEKGSVTHHVEVSRFPNWEGTAQVRYFTFLDDQIQLRTPPIPALGQEWIVDLVWERKA